MKEKFLKIFCAVLAGLLVVSVSLSGIALSRSYSKAEIDELLNSYQEALKSDTTVSIATIDEQIENINGSIQSLKTLDNELKGYIDTLKTQAEALSVKLTETDTKIEAVKKDMGDELTETEAELLASLTEVRTEINEKLLTVNNSISVLTEKDKQIDTKIAELETFIGVEIQNEKNWVNATFATLAQHKDVVKDIADVKAQITANTEDIVELDASLSKKLNDAIEAVQVNLKSWVGEQLDGYYTIAETNAKLEAQKKALEISLAAQKASLEALVSDLSSGVAADSETMKTLIGAANTSIKACEEAIKANKTEVDKLKINLTALEASLTSAYRTAIEEAIRGINVSLTATNASIQAAVNTINGSITTLDSKIVAIEDEIDIINTSLENLKFSVQTLEENGITQVYLNDENDLIFVLGDGTVVNAGYVGFRVTLSFETNGGSELNEQLVKQGGYAEKPSNPVKEDYAFAGWYIDEALTTPFDFESTVVRENLVLYAKWAGEGEFAYVTFMYNDGTDSVYQMQPVIFGGTAERPTDPILAQHSFVNWYTESEAANEFDFSTPIMGNTFLYAKWGAPDGDESTLYSASSGGGTNYSITGVAMEDQQLTVTVNANTSAILVARFYLDTETLFTGNFETDPNAPALITAASARTPDYAERQPVELSVTETLPQYFYIVVDMYDDYGNKLCESFVSIDETARYEAFENTSIDDFDEDLVLRFSNGSNTWARPGASSNDNFAVLNENVRIITSNESVNTLTVTYIPQVLTGSEEESVGLALDNVVYTFANPDSALMALRAGDVVYIDGTTYLFKIGEIVEDNGSLIMIESDDVQLVDFYQFIKVDMMLENDGYQDQNIFEMDATTYDWEIVDGNMSLQLLKNIEWSPYDWLTLNGEVAVIGRLHLKIVYDFRLFREDYVEIEYSSDFEFHVTASVEIGTDFDDIPLIEKEKEEIDLGKLHVPTPVAGLVCIVELSIPVELEAKGSFNLEYKTEIKSGFKYNSFQEDPQEFDEKESSVKAYFKGQASVKVGPKIEGAIGFCGDVVCLGLNVGAGVIAEAQTNDIGFEDWSSEKHACELCIEGTLKWYAEVFVELKYCISKGKLEGSLGKIEILSITRDFPISPNFYVSVLNSEDSYLEGELTFGWGSCPNQCYRTKIIVQDTSGNPIEDIDIRVKHNRTGSVQSGKSTYTLYLYKGMYTVEADAGTGVMSKMVTVTDSAQEVILTGNTTTGGVYGKVVDAVTGDELRGATITISQNGTNIASIRTAQDGSYYLDLGDGTYLITTQKEGYQTFKESITISNGAMFYLQTTQLMPELDAHARGGFSGKILNSVTGSAVGHVRLEIRAGWNNIDQGEIIDVIYSDEYGNFRYELHDLFGIEVGLEPGEYTLKAERDGYTLTSHNITVIGGVETGGQGFSMSPIMGERQYRFVLTWGSRPSDLDSHLIAPLENGGTFHLYYPDAETNGSHSYRNYFTLDLDDTTSEGPETTTIHTAIDGKYYFYVHNYSGEYALSASGAKVDVYCGNEHMGTFNVPINQSGRYWSVFVLDTENNVILPINTISNSPVTG